MRYCFKCKNGHEKTVNFPMGQVKEVVCDECGEKMFQNYHSSVMIPDYMQAGSEEADQMEWVRNRMNTRPSGNAKAVY